MMRTYRFTQLTGISDLMMSEEAMPEPGHGQVLVKIEAVALNFRDIAPALGRYVWNAKAGLIPCSDAAGEIVSVGEGAAAFKPGDKVISTFHPRWFGGRPPITTAGDQYGTARDGWLCEYKVVSQEAVVKLPAGLSPIEGATLPCAGLTAWTALTGPVPVRAGQSVLTLGSGGVSLFAVQLAKLVGAEVVATTSSDSKAARLKQLGVDHVVNYSQIKDWGAHVKSTFTGGVGVDCVVEVGGPGTINQSLDAVRWGGEVVLIGFLTQDNPGIDYFKLKGSGASTRSIGVGDRAGLEDLVRAVARGGLKPVIDRVFGFDAAREAFEHLHGSSHFGKIVISLTA